MTGVGLDPFGPEDFGRVMARRLTDIAATAARYESFAFTERRPSAERDEAPADRALLARDLALAALRAAGDPIAYAMLRRMADSDAPLADLVAETALPRLAVWERVNGLVAAGLAGRSHETDSAGLTPAGRALVDFVETAVTASTKF
ncbi:MAG TPA: hypothetical protein VHL53_10770 [Acidimicrobiia bacterium]|nr:hypothetical protein [Acidimicrobiia bacterium]